MHWTLRYQSGTPAVLELIHCFLLSLLKKSVCAFRDAGAISVLLASVLIYSLGEMYHPKLIHLWYKVDTAYLNQS